MAVASAMPEQIGSYRVVRRLGPGDPVEVFLAEDTNPSYRGDRVVVKRIRLELAVHDPASLAGIRAESELAGKIQHPNVAQLLDVVLHSGAPCLVMEYVDGATVDQLAQAVNGPMDPAVVAEIARQLCEALGALHALQDATGRPRIHRYVRPTTVAVNRRGDVKLLDLGVTRAALTKPSAGEDVAGVAWMAPEQARGEQDLTPAVDQYAVGVIVFELLSGIPFLAALEALAVRAGKQANLVQLARTEDSLVLKLDDIMVDESENATPFDEAPPGEPAARRDWGRRQLPRHLHDLDRLPGAGLDVILGRMLAYAPDDRYPSTQEAAAELIRWAWGATSGVDFRQFITDTLAVVSGEPVAQAPRAVEEPPPLDEEAIKAAADSTLVPKAIVLGLGDVDSAFVPPSATPDNPRRTNNLAMPRSEPLPTVPTVPVPGALMDTDIPVLGELTDPGSGPLPGGMGYGDDAAGFGAAGAMAGADGYGTIEPQEGTDGAARGGGIRTTGGGIRTTGGGIRTTGGRGSTAQAGGMPPGGLAPAQPGAYGQAYPPGAAPVAAGSATQAPGAAGASKQRLYVALGAALLFLVVGGAALFMLMKQQKSATGPIDPSSVATLKADTSALLAANERLNRRLEEPLPPGERGGQSPKGAAGGATTGGGSAGAPGMRGLRGADGEPMSAPAAGAPQGRKPPAGLEPVDGEVPELAPEQLKPYQGTRRKGIGHLTISTSPPGGQVILDGMLVERAPVTWERVNAGQHQLILRSDELGVRDVRVLDLRNGEHFRGTWSFMEKRWVQLD